jgi:hypothetical protein
MPTMGSDHGFRLAGSKRVHLPGTPRQARPPTNPMSYPQAGVKNAGKEDSMQQRIFIYILVGLFIGLAAVPSGFGQAPVAGEGPPPAKLSAKQLEDLVGRIALYPDDLLAIVLPASTFPLDIVQAERFLQKFKKDSKLQPDSRWDESVRSLLNYPEVVTMMSQDLEWTQSLGEAVVSQQGEVMKAIQTFRGKASKAGNLKTDDKQIVVQEKETIKIVPANPEVIYVPQYQPSTVVVYQSGPVYGYYPTPYPVYYYPYPPGAALATGLFFGAATAWAFNWGHGHIEHNVNINRTDNLNVNRNNPQYQQRADQARQQAQGRGDQARQTTQQSGQQRGDQARQQAQQRSGGQGGEGSKWQSQKRPGEVGGAQVSNRMADTRPGSGSGGGSRGDSFGNAGRGSEATQDSSRGSQSRASGASTLETGGSRGGGATNFSSSGSRGSGATDFSSSGSRGGGGSSMSSGSRGGGGGGGSRGGGGGGGSRGGGGGGGRR